MAERSRTSDEREPDDDSTSSKANLGRRGLLRGLSSTALGGLLGANVWTGTSSAHDRPRTDAGEESGTPVSVETLVDRMTLEEKVNRLHMHVGPAPDAPVGYVAPTSRLDVPGLEFADGPAGVRHPQTVDPRGARSANSTFEAVVQVLSGGPSTAFPAPVSQISTWDERRLEEFGHALGLEAKAKSQESMFAPAFNIVRVPEGGRAFEYFGEDPYLAGWGAVSAINGIQSTGTIATAKHFVANSQETARSSYSAEVSERALREIYLPAFRASVEDAAVGSVMAAVNRVNGTYCTEHEWLLTDVLKEEWGFEGYVVSDYMGTRSTAPAATAGLDLEGNLNPGGATTGSQYFGPPLKEAVESGEISESRIDNMVGRLLSQFDRFGMLDGNRDGPPGEANTPEHQQLARDIAAEGAVLLKNEPPGLPIDLDTADSIAVIGHDAAFAKTGGGGSANVFGPYSVSPLAGIRSRVGPDTVVTHASGQESTEPAVALAEQSDVAIVVADDEGTEGFDRTDLKLAGNQNQLIADVAAANDHTVVVLNTGGPVVMPWVEQVTAILQMWYPGMEDGNATADVLFGDVNPGGKLPMTFGKRREDYPATEEEEYPGVDQGDGYLAAEYSEGIFVGYRHFDEEGIEPLFPFGHGLSYTEFAYSDPEVPASTSAEEVPVEFTVENTGRRPGSEVVQVYVHDRKASVERPPKELKAFEKVRLAPGETTRIAFTLQEDAFSFFDLDEEEWTVEPGRFSILVGSSSRDIRLMEDLTVNASGRESGTQEDQSIRTTPFVGVTREDDGTVFTAGQTNQVNFGIRSTEKVRIRDRLPDGWKVVGGDEATTYTEEGQRYVEFDASIRDATLTYFVEGPSGLSNTGKYRFGPVEYRLDDEWVAATGTEDTNAIIGAGMGI